MSKIKLSENIVKDVSTFIFQPGNGVHGENIDNALQYMKNIPNDVTIISGDKEEIHSNKFILSLFSPTLRHLLSTASTLLLPECSTISIKYLLNMINNGFAVTEKLSREDMNAINETAKLMFIEMREIYHDKTAPSFERSNTCLLYTSPSPRD